MQKFRRRHILGTALALPFAAALWSRTSLFAAPNSDIIAGEWVQAGNDFLNGTLDHARIENGSLIAGPTGGSYTSPEHALPNPFQSVTALWNSTPGVRTEIRTRATQTAAWSEWLPMIIADESSEHPAAGLSASTIVSVPLSRYIQYHVLLPAGSKLSKMRITGMDASNGPTGKEQLKELSVAALAEPGAPPIISRAGWGANEKYRYTRSGEMIWPYEYKKPYKIILHHTVTPNNEANPAATVRSIYYYHAITLGWGDIGYNFLIDWKGNIYEGRAGGPNVVGGHALKYNYGSIGIAVMGTYTHTPISNESFNSVMKLVAWKLDSLKIDPLGKGWFIDHTTYNICGHRDAMPGQTTCPGDGFYGQLQAVRTAVSDQLNVLPITLTPEDSSWVSGNQVVIQVATTGSVNHTDLLLNDSPKASNNGPNLEYKWDTTGLAQGATATFKAIATDAKGQKEVVTSTLHVDNHPPDLDGYSYDVNKRTSSIKALDPDSGVNAGSAEFRIKDKDTWGDWREVPGKKGDPTKLSLIVPAIRTTASAIQFRVADAAGNQTESQIFVLQGSVTVDSRFQRYYQTYDGSRTLGSPLTPIKQQNGVWVQYFEKGRLEDRSSETTNPDWKIQYGLLVDELHTAQSDVPIGGDMSSLTYDSLHDLAASEHRVKPPSGYAGHGVMTVRSDGTTFIPFSADLGGADGHMVLGGFWNYINRKGLFPGGWLHDVGLPISEPTNATVTKNFPGGPVQRNIIVQAFQRTILTYDPANPADWQIERANVGTDYLTEFQQYV